MVTDNGAATRRHGWSSESMWEGVRYLSRLTLI